MKKIVFTFGRYNPPTTGHSELITYAVKLAQRTGAEHRIYTSQSHDASKNPLAPKQKMAFLRQIFPGVNFVDDPSMKTAFHICKKLTNEGYEDVTFVVGADRLTEFKTQLGRYVKPKTAKDFNPKIHYPFKNFKVESSGARKQGISGTDLRSAVRRGDFTTFAKASAAKDKSLVRKIFTATKQNLAEQIITEQKGMSRKEFDKLLNSFVDYTCKYLSIKEKPSLHYKDDKGEGQPSFGGYAPHSKQLMVYTKHRHPMDILRTVAHELVHHKQNENGDLGKNIAKESGTGSKIENEANSEAGKIMRYFGKENPFYFDMSYVTEEKAIILAGTPGSGKDRMLKEAILPFGFTEVSSTNLESDGNIVVTGSFSYSQIKSIKEELESNGYGTMFVFVNTSDETSKLRNEERGKRGGRVISEMNRFTKWQDAQDILEKCKKLFEVYAVIDNSIDANTLKEQYEDAVHFLEKHVRNFVVSEIDQKFENMINETHSDFSPVSKNNPVGGAGNWGTTKLSNRYKKDTPGQYPDKNIPMKVIDTFRKHQTAPIGGDRIGDEAGLPKSPGFGDNQTMDFVSLDRQIDRWMVKEETRRMFKAKYGALADKKLKETAARLAREGMEDPAGGFTSMVSSTGGPPEQVDNFSSVQYGKELEKKSLFGKKRFKKYKNTK